ncbi:LysR family transcriptional regulator [Microbacterium indicum]|uniref:LysR family transcriptional regulator n=1 Tax=Microbacterium indicum TaxID=358100 RepID=UPI00048F3F2E|nr:LysR family transcriptional regulator [Microbacterium indicum]
MDWSLRELRVFVAAVDAGTFTDAAIALGVSQAQVSRTIASLERRIGDPLLRRVPRGCEPTAFGTQVLPHARRLLAEAERFSEAVSARHGILRLGYAWAALGERTPRLQRAWAARHPDRELHLVRRNSPTAGLSEGVCDVAVVRNPVDERRFGSAVVGLERRLVAFASDDPEWARRRRLTMAEVAKRTVVVDARTGTTRVDLWAGTGAPPRIVESHDVDEWLDTIAAGTAVGTTAEATAHHHARSGVTFRPITDGPRVPVRLAWWRDDPPGGLAELIAAVTDLYAEGGNSGS